MEMLLTGHRLNARDALCLKLVNQVVPRHDLLPTAERLANKIKTYRTEAVNCAKEAVTRGLDLTLEQGLRLEAELGCSLH